MSAVASSEKKARLKEKDQMQVAAGPSSLSPGQWLTDVYIAGLDMADADVENESFLSAIAILQSYKFGHRARVLRYPVKQEDGEGSLTEFNTEPESIETKSLVFVSMTTQEIEKSQFSMMGTRASVDYHSESPAAEGDDEDISDGRLPEESSVDVSERELALVLNGEVTKPEPKPKGRLVTMACLIKSYDIWFSAPSDANHDAFFEDLFTHLERRMKNDFSRDGHKMRSRGRDQEILNEILTRIGESIRKKTAKNDRIEKFDCYLNRSWKRGKITELKKLSTETRLHPSAVSARESDDSENAAAIGAGERHDYTQWKIDAQSIADLEGGLPKDPEEVKATRLAKLPLLPQDTRDYTGLKLRGLNDLEVAKSLGKSRWAVGRLKQKTVKALQAVAVV